MASDRVFSEIEEQLKEQGYRMTLPRKLILSILSLADSHLMAKEIYVTLAEKNPEIGLTTVYRTLDLLVRMGLVNKFEFGDGQSRYELAWKFKEHHHHLVCLGCGQIIDYNDFIDEEVNFFPKIQKSLSRKYNFRIENHELYFYGKCRNCR